MSTTSNVTVPTGIPNISSSLTQQAASGTAATKTTEDQFMQLFIAQLQNQDPLSPQDSSAFLAQLAQMSQLEETTQTNTQLSSLADAQSAANRASLSQMVGKNVTATASSLTVRDSTATIGATPVFSVHSDVDAKDLQLNLTDASGTVVKTIDLGAHPAGDFVLDNSKLSNLPMGTLTFSVAGKANDGTAITGTAQLQGTIDAMQMGDSGNSFRIGPFNVAPAAITSVGASSP